MPQAAIQPVSAPAVQAGARQESARYAIYYSPSPNHPLRQAAASWLERDASAAAIPGGNVGCDGQRLQFVSEPRRYGFHATLKPPFRLAPGQSLSSLKKALESFSLTNWPCPLGPMRIELVRGFFALVPRAETPRIKAFASAIVEQFDGFRAPFDAGEMHRRLADDLDDDEATNLVRWGYPYVFDRFRFHMTLTNKIAVQDRSSVKGDLDAHFDSLLDDDLHIDALTLFEQAQPGDDFIETDRFEFRKGVW